eukprot:929160-Rhodomonas_salina.1
MAKRRCFTCRSSSCCCVQTLIPMCDFNSVRHRTARVSNRHARAPRGHWRKLAAMTLLRYRESERKRMASQGREGSWGVDATAR